MASQFQSSSFFPSQPNTQNRKISYNPYPTFPTLFPAKRTFSFQQPTEFSTQSSFYPRSRILTQEEMSLIPSSELLFAEKEDMEDFEWNFPLYSAGSGSMESSLGGSSNSGSSFSSEFSQKPSSTMDLNFNLKEEMDLDLFGTSNVTLGPTAVNPGAENFHFNTLLDPVLFQSQIAPESKPQFSFNYAPATENAGELFTNHHLSLGKPSTSNVATINESPILFSNSYDAPSQPAPVQLVAPDSSFLEVPNFLSPIQSQAQQMLMASPSSLSDMVPEMSPMVPDLDSNNRARSMDSDDEEEGMPQTPAMGMLGGGFGFSGLGMGTPLVRDDFLEDTLLLGVTGGLPGINFSSLSGLNSSVLMGANGTGTSPVLDLNKPGMKELLKMFPGLANVEPEVLEKILTPPSGPQVLPPVSNLNSIASAQSHVQSKVKKISRVTHSATGSPALEGMMVRTEIAKRRRTPAEKAAQQEREKSMALFGDANSIVATASDDDTKRRSSCMNPDHRRLIDLEAPTQARNYISASSTSRKPTHTTVSKRKAAILPDGSHAIEDEERVEKKRRQNTLSARRSRARRQEVIDMLEDRKKVIVTELEEYQHRVEEAERKLRELRGEVIA